WDVAAKQYLGSGWDVRIPLLVTTDESGKITQVVDPNKVNQGSAVPPRDSVTVPAAVEPPPRAKLVLVGTCNAMPTVKDTVSELCPTFKADGTYVLTTNNDAGTIVQKGTYIFANNILTLTPEGSAAEPGTVTVINENEFVYQRDGMRINFRRQ